MIPRTLVPIDARPPATNGAEPPSRRRPTTMDERTLVPAMLPIVVLDGHTNIPTNLSLDSISARVVVPRDINREAYGVVENHTLPAQPTELDERVTVPLGSSLPEIVPPAEYSLPDIVDQDIFTSGEIQLAVPEQKEKRIKPYVVLIGAIAVHLFIFILILLYALVFPAHIPTAEEQEIARNQMRLILPPGAFELNQPRATPQPPAAHVHVDPNVIRKVAPPEPAPAPKVTPPPTPPRELPAAPIAKPNAAQQAPQDAPTPKVEAPKPGLRLETPDTPQPNNRLLLPKSSSSTLQDAIRDSARNPNAGGGRSGAVIGPGPKPQGVPGSGHQGGPGTGSYGNGYEILTPLEGVDFSDYMARVVNAVRRNWYAVMPESAQLGDRGRVMLQFRIMRDGSVPTGEPNTLMGSGKEPLDRAAVSAIRSSNPFEPLPPKFSGPSIELRFYFLYNLPIEDAYK
jgi:TonB family protein